MPGSHATPGPARRPVAARVRRAVSRSRLPSGTRLALAARSALAAVVAWHVAALVPGAGDYLYYAPLGALLVTYPTVVDTVSSAWRSLFAVASGGLLGAVCLLLPERYGLGLALAVGVGVLLAGVPAFGSQRAWVPTAALFTLLVGSGDPVEYLAAYAGLVLLGALVGVVVGLVAPSSLQGRAERQNRSALHEAAVLLGDLADDVETGSRSRTVQERVGAVRDGITEAASSATAARKAARGNVRLSRRSAELTAQQAALQREQRLAVVVVDLVEQLSDAELGVLGADPVLGARTGAALRAVGRAVAPERCAAPHEVVRDRGDEAVRELSLAVRQRLVAEESGGAGDDGPDPLPVAASVLTATRRLLDGSRDAPYP
ncbi:hypothetical protein [Aquipuribacter sp. SD81]|uniref:hypothetical protein n=1 Tax=Aquipuribacter sp. SD81 TaxID=3127703 RepID=UPI0030181F51